MLISSLPLVDILFTLSHPSPLGLLPQVFEQAFQVAKALATLNAGNSNDALQTSSSPTRTCHRRSIYAWYRIRLAFIHSAGLVILFLLQAVSQSTSRGLRHPLPRGTRSFARRMDPSRRAPSH